MDKYQLSPSEQKLLEGLAIPLAVYQFVNKRVVTLALSDGFCELFGYDRREDAYRFMDSDMYRDTHPDDASRIADAAFRFATLGGTYDVIYRTRKFNGSDYRTIHAIGRHVYTESGVRLAQISYTDEGPYMEDSGEQTNELSRELNNALHEESLLKASYYDYLTGLPSMTYFFELADAGRNAILKAGGHPVMLYMDLSGMKFFNTRHGFTEGDKLLRSFGKLLASTFNNENCSHFGADHFVAFTDNNDLEARLLGLFDAFQQMHGTDALPVRVGIYTDRPESVPPSTACDRAKFACDTLRNNYYNCWNYYSQELLDDAERRQYILENLDRAIEERWVQVYYQPIVRAVTGKVCDEEALSRWIDPVRGFLSPAEFIPTLEEAGVIYKLDLFVLEEALRKLKAQQEAGIYTVPQSVNLSRSDFDACDIVEEIRRRVDEAGVRRELITIEITESIIGQKFEFMQEQILRFQELGFPVWMDDFGSGYSSIDVLQTIKFDLIKFDMSFMRKLDEGGGRIILTELVKMATALGVDTVCEGVETEEQVRFLREIGCSKLQGFYYSKPISLSELTGRFRAGTWIGYENPAECGYYETIGRVNLYDLAMVASGDDINFQNIFNTLPMAVMEVSDGKMRFVRSNQSYRDFMRRYFGFDLSRKVSDYTATPFGTGSVFMNLVRECCLSGSRAFYDEKMPDGSVVHSFARRLVSNPITGTIAVAIAVLSITDENEGATYASIARALASDYYNIYYVDLETGDFIEYTSPVGGEELAVERRGKDFFGSSLKDAERIYEEDRETFYAAFNKDNIIRELDAQGVFNITYRLVDSGVPLYAGMKVVRTYPDGKHIVIGISIIDAQKKQQEAQAKLLRERAVFERIAALAGNYLTLYTVDPVTDRYIEYSTTEEYDTLGLAKAGENFFETARLLGSKLVPQEDLALYLESFTREKTLRAIEEKGVFVLRYRLTINGMVRPVALRAARIHESDGDKLIVGINLT